VRFELFQCIYNSGVSPEPQKTLLSPQTLLFDADDTLWENNIYFEQAIASFISYLDHRVHSPAEVREHLNHCERVTIAAHGYGLESFRRSLIDCFEALSEAPDTAQHHNQIVSFTEAIASSQIDLLPDVESTLRELSLRHRCILVTKGNLVEQTGKLERSGLQTFFTEVEVLAEKNEAAYRELIGRHGLEPATTWMIGNSPKSDVNPSLAAGLNAVFLPHDSTWVLEHEVVHAALVGRELVQLKGFGELLQYF
jgi:putative hydrolase of the HAD superfamily